MQVINAAFRSAGTSQRLFVNKFRPVLGSDVCLIDKFSLIAKLGRVCQTHTSKWHFQSDMHRNGQRRKSFGPNGHKCGLTGANQPLCTCVWQHMWACVSLRQTPMITQLRPIPLRLGAIIKELNGCLSYCFFPQMKTNVFVRVAVFCAVLSRFLCGMWERTDVTASQCRGCQTLTHQC